MGGGEHLVGGDHEGGVVAAEDAGTGADLRQVGLVGEGELLDGPGAAVDDPVGGGVRVLRIVAGFEAGRPGSRRDVFGDGHGQGRRRFAVRVGGGDGEGEGLAHVRGLGRVGEGLAREVGRSGVRGFEGPRRDGAVGEDADRHRQRVAQGHRFGFVREDDGRRQLGADGGAGEGHGIGIADAESAAGRLGAPGVDADGERLAGSDGDAGKVGGEGMALVVAVLRHVKGSGAGPGGAVGRPADFGFGRAFLGAAEVHRHLAGVQVVVGCRRDGELVVGVGIEGSRRRPTRSPHSLPGNRGRVELDRRPRRDIAHGKGLRERGRALGRVAERPGRQGFGAGGGGQREGGGGEGEEAGCVHGWLLVGWRFMGGTGNGESKH